MHKEQARYLRRSAGSFDPGEGRGTVDYDNHVFEVFGGRVKIPATTEATMPHPLNEGDTYNLVYDGHEFRPQGNYLVPVLKLVRIEAAANVRAAS